MKVEDLYTKVVLTIIAACLVCIAFARRPQAVQAAGATPVVITGIEMGGNVPHMLPIAVAATWNCNSSQVCSWISGSPVRVSVLNNPMPVSVANPNPLPVSVENRNPLAVSVTNTDKTADPH